MSEKIINMLDSSNFRRESDAFKAAVIETAINDGLISYDFDRGLFHHKGRILLGMLPDPDGRVRLFSTEATHDRA